MRRGMGVGGIAVVAMALVVTTMWRLMMTPEPEASSGSATTTRMVPAAAGTSELPRGRAGLDVGAPGHTLGASDEAKARPLVIDGSPRAAPAGQFAGRVVRQADGSGIVGVHVWLYGPSDDQGRPTVLDAAFTDGRGAFSFTGLDPRRPPRSLRAEWAHEYTSRYADMRSSTPTGLITDAEWPVPDEHAWWTDQTFVLDTGWILVGEVRDPHGQPVRALVAVGPFSCTSDRQGQFRLPDLPRAEGPLSVVVYRVDRPSTIQPITAPSDGTWTLRVSLTTAPESEDRAWWAR